jgi:hypothetical protein
MGGVVPVARFNPVVNKKEAAKSQTMTPEY